MSVSESMDPFVRISIVTWLRKKNNREREREREREEEDLYFSFYKNLVL